MEVSGQLNAQPLYLQGKRPWYPVDRSLGGPQIRSGYRGEENNSHPLLGLEPLLIQPVGQRCTTELSRLLTMMVKVKVSLCFKRALRHEGVLGEWRYSSAHSLTSALNGGELSASRPGLFAPRERALVAHWLGGSVDPRAVLDTA
jgi:hypothetical protein